MQINAYEILTNDLPWGAMHDDEPIWDIVYAASPGKAKSLFMKYHGPSNAYLHWLEIASCKCLEKGIKRGAGLATLSDYEYYYPGSVVDDQS
jgi:hypothetical protein